MTAHDPDVTLGLLRAVAAHGLPGASPAWPPEPLPDRPWQRLRAVATADRLSGLLVAAILDGALPATERQRTEATDSHLAAMAHVLDLEAVTLEVVATLRRAGIDVRLLKGSAVAHLDYPDPALRAFADVDLLVPPGALPDAAQVLALAGFERDLPPRRQIWELRYAKDVTLYAPAGAVQVDLHRCLVAGPFGTAIRLEDLWGPPEHVTLAGVPLPALGAELRLVHAAYTAMLGDYEPRLVALRDVAQLMARPGLLAEALRIARGWRGDVVISGAVGLAVERLGICAPEEDSGRLRPLRPTRREARWLGCYRSHGGSNSKTLLGGVLGLESPAERARYLAALTVPSRRYRAARATRNRRTEWRQAARELLRR
jgi:hypothetical protein